MLIRLERRLIIISYDERSKPEHLDRQAYYDPAAQFL